MALMRGRGRENKLTRWVNRHTQAATLFGSSRQLGTQSPTTRFVQPRLNNVSVGTRSVEENTLESEGPSVPAGPIPDTSFVKGLVRSKGSSDPTSPSLSLRYISASETGIPENTAKAPSSYAVSPVMETITATSTAEAQAGTTEIETPPSKSIPIVDQEWQRLEKIFHAHQQKQQPIGIVEAQPGFPTRDKVPAPARAPHKTSSVYVQLEPDQADVPRDMLHPDSTDNRDDQLDPITKSGKETGSCPIVPSKEIHAIHQTKPVYRTPPLERAPLSPMPEPEELTEHPTVSEQRRPSKIPDAHQEAQQIIQAKQDEEAILSLSGGGAEPVLQPVPLEFAWAVQRIHPQEVFPKDMESQAAVEPASESRKKIPSMHVASNEETVPPTVVPRDPEQVADVPSSQKPYPPKSTATASPSNIQLKAEKEVVSPPAQSPTMVPTAIGLLPGDLWQLLGQESPASKPAEMLSASAVQKTMRSQAQVAGDDFPELNKLRSSGSGSTCIQRQSEPDVQNPLNEENAKNEHFEQPGEQPPAGVDLDELSRLVYTELKSRLKLENERTHGRI